MRRALKQMSARSNTSVAWNPVRRASIQILAATNSSPSVSHTCLARCGSKEASGSNGIMVSGVCGV